MGFEFRKYVFFLGTAQSCCIFFGLLDKCCIFKCYIFFNSIFWLKLYTPGTSVIMVLHYYQIVLNFCQMNSVLQGIL